MVQREAVPVRTRAMPWAEQRGLVFFTAWTVFGLFLDGWAHNHHRPETFFTPWHGVLYSGVGAGIVWAALDGRRQSRLLAESGETRVPVAGERLTAIGAAIFLVAAGGDFIWHAVFGIEVGIEALLSPTHLGLMGGGMLLASAPARAAFVHGRRDADRRELAPVLLSVILTTAVASFFAQYLSAFRTSAPSITGKPTRSIYVEMVQTHGIAAVLATTILLVGPLVLMARRFRLPTGAATTLFTVVTVAVVGLDGFTRAALVIAAVAGGVVADILLARGASLRLVASAAPVAMWVVYFVTYRARYGLGWGVDLWAGVTVLAALCGLGLSLLAVPPGDGEPMPHAHGEHPT